MKKSKVDLKIKLGSYLLNSPIILASGTCGYGIEFQQILNPKYIGAVISKTVTLLPSQGNPPPRVVELGCGVINSVGLQNPGIDYFISNILPKLAKLKTKFIVSVGGSEEEEFASIVKKLKKHPEVKIIELNFSCPNLRKKRLIAQDANKLKKITKKVKQLFGRDIIVKLTPEVSDIAKIAKAAVDSGADIISLVNTFMALSIDIENLKPRLGNIYGGYSGPAIKPLALYRLKKVADAVKVPIIAGGGIFSWEDAVEFLLLGASAVSIGTVNMVNPLAGEEIAKGIEGYLLKKGIFSLKELPKLKF